VPRNVGRDLREILLGLGRGNPGLQTTDERKAFPPAVATLLWRQNVQRPDDRTQRASEALRQLASRWKTEPLRQNAGEGCRITVQRDHPSADARVPTEAAPPQTMRDHHDASPRLVSRLKRPSNDGLHAQHVEKP